MSQLVSIPGTGFLKYEVSLRRSLCLLPCTLREARQLAYPERLPEMRALLQAPAKGWANEP